MAAQSHARQAEVPERKSASHATWIPSHHGKMVRSLQRWWNWGFTKWWNKAQGGYLWRGWLVRLCWVCNSNRVKGMEYSCFWLRRKFLHSISEILLPNPESTIKRKTSFFFFKKKKGKQIKVKKGTSWGWDNVEIDFYSSLNWFIMLKFQGKKPGKYLFKFLVTAFLFLKKSSPLHLNTSKSLGMNFSAYFAESMQLTVRLQTFVGPLTQTRKVHLPPGTWGKFNSSALLLSSFLRFNAIMGYLWMQTA